MLKRVASNLARGGVLAIPGVGSGIEKAVFGPLDDKQKEEEREELLGMLGNLRRQSEFISADTKSQLEMLADKIEVVNKELSESIRGLNPFQIETQIIQYIQPTIINVLNVLPDEKAMLAFDRVGVSQQNLLTGVKSGGNRELLFDSVVQAGKLPDLIEELDSLSPGSVEMYDDDKVSLPKDTIVDEFRLASRSLLNWPLQLVIISGWNEKRPILSRRRSSLMRIAQHWSWESRAPVNPHY